MNKFLIQYASNLFVHQNQTLKQSQNRLKTGICTNLALLGNIGNPRSQKTKDFVRWCSDNWDQVYCVPGPVELLDSERLNGLFPNFPNNVHILDQSEKLVNENLMLLGCPLWSGWADKIESIREWNQEERNQMANRSPGNIRYWHEDDVEYIAEKIRYNEAVFGDTRKLLLLTHNLFDARMISLGMEGHENRNIYLSDGKIGDLLSLSLKGILCGAGGGTHTGYYGNAMAVVNCAFRGPNMVPNPLYRTDAIASFRTDDYYGNGALAQYVRNQTLRNLSKYLPKPQLVSINHANTILQ